MLLLLRHTVEAFRYHVSNLSQEQYILWNMAQALELHVIYPRVCTIQYDTSPLIHQEIRLNHKFYKTMCSDMW